MRKEVDFRLLATLSIIILILVEEDAMSAHVRYIEKAGAYFSMLGYTNEYRWPHFSEVPFTALKKPLSDCCLAIVTTSYVEEKAEENTSKNSEIVLMGDVYEIDSHLKASDLFCRHEGYDSYATNVDDVDSFFPITRLHDSVAEGRVGSVAPFFYNAFSTYSKRRTEQIDGPAVLKGCYEHSVDAAILTAI
jgi:D-proline reductase (dithiol) PrdB